MTWECDKRMIVRKVLTVAVILLFIGMSIPSTATVVEKKFSMTFYDGDTLYVGGDGSGNYSKIQAAIDNASNGDTVFVYDDSSPYYENVIVDKSINLIGENRYTTVIDGGGSGDVVYVPDDGVNISGFTITNGSSGNAGISISGNHNTIKDNRLLENNYDGIRIHGRFDNIIENEISNNSHNAIALGLDAEDNTIVDNTIANNGGFGILIWSGRNVIENNVISNNLAYGIYLHYSDRNVIENNIISSNFEYGIYIDSPSVNNNSIYHNNFVNHTENAYDTSSNTWDNGYPSGGNYWDDYNGVDNDGDGIGDTPYTIPGGDNQDRYPLMRPYGQTELEITKVKGGIFSFTIKNVGDETAINVSWSIHFEGGIVFPREQHSFNNYDLAPDEERTIIFWPSYIPEDKHLVFGIGRVKITMVANADNAPLVSKSVPGFLFLFFIIINPGG